MKFLVYSGTITPSEDRTFVIEQEEEKSFSWTFTPGTDESIVDLFLYNGTKSDENKLWDVANKILKKGEEMFNGRLEVTYDNQKEITVSITNAMLNDSITILLTGFFFHRNSPSLSSNFNYSVILDVQGNYILYFK